MEKAGSAEANDLPDGMDLPAELVRRQDRLAALDAARSEIKRRADARDVGLINEYEQKQPARQDQRDGGGWPGGRERATRSALPTLIQGSCSLRVAPLSKPTTGS